MTISKSSKIELDKDFFAKKSVVIAKSGYGKSYTVRVIIEEGLSRGHTFFVIDPQDAYLNLPGFDYINAKDIISPEGFGILLSQCNRNIVLQTRRLTLDEQNKIVKRIINFYRKNIKKGIQTIIIDEIHKFAPESQKTESKETIRGMFQENRSDGLGCIAVTQRISRLDKTILSQADHMIIGKVTSFRDKEAVKNYIDNPDDLSKISKLKKGEFYLYGFDQLDDAQIVAIRIAKTEHSGNSPDNLLEENPDLYNKYISKVVRRNKTMENVTKDETVKNLIPSMDGFLSLAKLGAKVSVGMAVGGLVGNMVGGRFASPVPLVSTRTLGSAVSTIVMYAGYRMIPNQMVKDFLKYGAAGNAAHTLGSLVFDALGFFNVKLPGVVNFALSTASGVPSVNVEKSADNPNSAPVDLNTAFQP
jgi:hypothetical protein